MTQTILSHEFPNGLTLLAEPMSWLESAAFTLLVPGGCSHDPPDLAGVGNFTCEMVQRGCGARDSRQFINDLENLGVDHSASVANAHTSFSGATQAEKIYDALAIFADLVQRPHLPEAQFEDARQVCFQEVFALEDDLARRMMLRLRQRHYADPYGRYSQGTAQSLQRIAPADVRRYYESTYTAEGAILAVAGKIDWSRLKDHVQQSYEDWKSQRLPAIQELPPPGQYEHMPCDSHQTHIGIAFPSVPAAHRDFYQARGAIGVLSDGSSSRLFTQVREQRGLCYAVDASYESLRDRASVQCYVGTTTERAQETLEVMLAELHRLGDGIQADELERLQARFKSALIMQQESSSARSGSMAGQWYFLGHVKTMEEIRQIIDNLTCHSINTYLAANPPRDFTIVTLGAKELEIPVGIS